MAFLQMVSNSFWFTGDKLGAFFKIVMMTIGSNIDIGHREDEGMGEFP